MEQVIAAFAEIGNVVKDYLYPIEDGCIENLDYEEHKRGKNWIATVKPNRGSPGGLDRAFWKHGSGRWYKAPDNLAAGDLIEMGGDYYTGRGKKRADRRYILVLRVEPDYFVGWFVSAVAPSGEKIKKAWSKLASIQSQYNAVAEFDKAVEMCAEVSR